MEELAELISNRENIYRFLGRLYKIETDQALLVQMAGISFPTECNEKELDEGYRMIESFLQHLDAETTTTLAVDYAKVFLGAGIAEMTAAYPYESVYTTPGRLIMQEARDQVMELYRAKGLGKSASLDLPEDHIALELEFIAYLCQETKAAIGAQNWTAIAASIAEQQEFLAKHLLNWVPEFSADIQKYAETKFYGALAKITSGYLRMDQALLEDLATEAAEEIEQLHPASSQEKIGADSAQSGPAHEPAIED